MTSIVPVVRLNQVARRTLGRHYCASSSSPPSSSSSFSAVGILLTTGRRAAAAPSSSSSSSGKCDDPIVVGLFPPPMITRRPFASSAAVGTSGGGTTTTVDGPTKEKKKTKNNATSPSSPARPPTSYQDRKDAAKQKRREAYDRAQDRLLRLSTRRDHSPRDVLRKKFREWWDSELVYHDHLLRSAKREGMPWRVRVSVMVERIPVVIPDMESWEKEYVDLRDWLWTYGKEYPEETGFMFAMDRPEDHVLPTVEELIAGLPFVPAPRETEADATGDVRTRDRRLKTSVYLAVRSDAEGNMSGPRWTLPSAIASADETLLDTAKRAVIEHAGTDMKLWCPGNAPMTVNLRVYNSNLPEEFRGGYYGEKIFYYRVQHDSGDVNADAMIRAGGVDDWGWLSKEEIVERVEGERGKHQAKFFHYML
ncbi:hypothetical protein ACHAW5_002471 [Stephanodiscus triporus]|uniref:Nudix hydrolase domain-containing protein n=1 Tax=Stephanodiscus triporus TaxID=2934178 RepID=A0ABD3QK20_9STRA